MFFCTEMLSLERYLMSFDGVTDWRGVGSHLGLSGVTLDQIQEDNRNHVKPTLACWRSVVREWMRTTSELRTEKQGLQMVANAMTKCGEHAATKRLYEKAGEMV